MERTQLGSTFASILELSSLTRQYLPEDPSDVDKVFEDDVFPDRWRDLHDGLKAVKRHICIPTGLSSGQRSIPHKGAAMVHALAMEMSSTDKMHEMLCTFKSYTSDMGT